MKMQNEKEDVIELYDYWTKIKARLGIVAPQPKHFSLRKEVIPITSIDQITTEVVNLDTSAAVGIGATETTELRPPQGWVYRIRQIDLKCPDPAGSGAGTHRWYMTYNGMDNYSMMLICDFGNQISISGTGFVANSSETPGAQREQHVLIREGVLVLTHDNFINIGYKNGTDVVCNTSRIVRFYVEKTPEGAQ